MDRRPLCLFCTIFMSVLIILNLTGITLIPKSRDLRSAEKLLAQPQLCEVFGVVASCDVREGYGIMTIKQSTLPWEGKNYAVGKVKVAYDGEVRYPCGWTVAVSGIAGVIRGPENPGEYDSAQSYRVRNIFIEVKKAEVRVLEKRTNRISEAMAGASAAADNCIRAVYPEDVSGVLCSMLTGNRTWLDDDTRGYWQAGGIMHMLAISGLHIGILGMGLYAIIRKAGVPLVPAGITVMLLMILYTFFVGCSVSSVRACIMFALMVTASYTGRTYDPMTALAAAALLILLKNPEYMFYSGFQLSAAAVVMSRIFRKRSIWMQALLLYLWMLPLVASVFYEVPLLSVPVNLIAVPLLPFIVGLGAGGCALGTLFGNLAALVFGEGAASASAALAFGEGAASASASLAPAASPAAVTAAAALRMASRACAYPAVVLVRLLGRLLREVSLLPGSVLVTGKPGVFRCCLYFVIILGWTYAYLRLRLSRLRFLLMFLIPVFPVLLAFRPSGDIKITFLSVGQGDGIVMEMYGDTAVITDCGSTTAYEVGKRRMEPFLRYEGIRYVPYIIATHMDEDHVSGIREMLEMAEGGLMHVKLGTLVLPAVKEKDQMRLELEDMAAKAGVRVLAARKGDVIRVGEAEIEIMGPDPEAEGDAADANAQCIVFALHYRDFDALMTGDVTGAGEELLTEQLRRKAEAGELSLEVLKVAHHGSAYSTPEEFLDIACPHISVISCGAGNRYGHPHEELLERLRASGSRIFRTDTGGAVTVRTDGRRYTAETFVSRRGDG